MYFINSQRTLCHIIEDIRTGKAPDTCGEKAEKSDVISYRYGQPHSLLTEKPINIPLCDKCQEGIAWAR